MEKERGGDEFDPFRAGEAGAFSIRTGIYRPTIFQLVSATAEGVTVFTFCSSER